MFEYEDYYKEPTEVEALFEEFSNKLKSMLKNEIVTNAKQYDVNKDEVKTMMMVAQGLKEEYERKLEAFDEEVAKAVQKRHDTWVKDLLNTDLKINDFVYKIEKNGCIQLKCPYCDGKGKVPLTLKGNRIEEVVCPVCRGSNPFLPKYEYKKVQVKHLSITLTLNDKDKKLIPYYDTWVDLPNYPFDKAKCHWHIKDERWDTLTSNKVAKTPEEAKQIIDALTEEEKNKIRERFGEAQVIAMLESIKEDK